MKPLVSVIIPTTNREAFLANMCGLSVKNSTYDNVEIIIVNVGLERSAQRNIGIGRAQGEYLLILDSDQRVSPELIADCVDCIGNANGVYIPEIITGDDWFSRFRNWERQFYVGTAIDVARFVRASVCPRFDETLNGPEDTEWERRIPGGRAVSSAVVFHDDRVDVKTYFRKKAYYAKSMRAFRDKCPNDNILRFKYRCVQVFLEGGKWKRILRAPGWTIVLLMVLMIRGLIYLKSLVVR